jgi:hypothetical protein
MGERPQRAEERKANKNLELLLVSVVNSFHNPRRQALWEEGLDERDMAVEVGFLPPAAVDGNAYTGPVRRPIVAAIETMRDRGWIEVLPPGNPYTIMRVRPTPEGQRTARALQQPWYRKLLARLRGRELEEA